MKADTLAAVFDALRQTVHGPAKQAKHTPWAGKPLIEIGGRNPEEAGKIIKAWIESGTLVRGEYYHNGSRHDVAKVTLDEAKLAAEAAELAPAFRRDADDLATRIADLTAPLLDANRAAWKVPLGIQRYVGRTEG